MSANAFIGDRRVWWCDDFMLGLMLRQDADLYQARSSVSGRAHEWRLRVRAGNA
jgi:hypothetical protein